MNVEKEFCDKINNTKKNTGYTIQIQMWQDCNLSCTHCWRDAKMEWEKLKLDLLINKLSDYMVFLKEKHKEDNLKVAISLTWGEIFLYFDKLLSILPLLDKYDFLELKLLTNWTLIKEEYLSILAKYKDRIVIQISIDWFQETHDKIRGKWTFKKSILTIKKLWDLWFRLRVQAVISDNNISELAGLVLFFCELPVKSIWFRKILWIWRAENIIKNWFNSKKYIDDFYWVIDQMRDYINLADKQLYLWCDVAAITKKYKSLAAHAWTCWVINNNVIWIEPDWKIFLCPRLPIKIWNVYEDSLIDINKKYDGIVSNIFKNSNKCNTCSEFKKCKWGDLCDIYTSYANLKNHTSFLCK